MGWTEGVRRVAARDRVGRPAKWHRFGAIQIVNSVDSIANVNTDKDQLRQGKGKGPRDPDAR
jgi:hypothetical protein